MPKLNTKTKAQSGLKIRKKNPRPDTLTPKAHKELMLKTAKMLMRRGLAVVVLKPGDKRPATSNGVGDATKSFKKLTALVRGMPAFNLGVATGDRSELVVLDVDPRNGGIETMSTIISANGQPGGNLPKVKTGDGYHLYARARKTSFNRTKLGPGIDVLGNRSYVLVPPSLHPNGQAYEWIRSLPPIGEKLPELNRAWRRAISTTLRKKAGPHKDKASAGQSFFPEGERNNRLISLAGRLRRKGQDEDEIRHSLRLANKKRCRPPLAVAEVDRIARNAAGYDNDNGDTDPMERLAKAFLKEKFRDGRCLRFEVDGRFWNHDGKVWAPIRDNILERALLDFMSGRADAPVKKRVNYVREIMQFLRISLAATDDLLHFRTAPPLALNLLNGELWILPNGKVELRKHSWKSGLRTLLQVRYDPKAKCREFDQALAAIFSKAENPQAMMDLWDELMGYIIQGRRHIPLILILFGTGGNGKTKLVETLRMLLGDDAVYSGSVHELGKNRFAYAALFGKQLFVDDDVEQGVRLPDGILKKISEEKELTADVKHREMFNFRSRVVPMLLCNNVPTLSDVSPGMRRRLMVIEFKRRFTGKSEDKDLFPRIWANELPGILNRALRGLARLHDRGRFEQPKDARKALDSFLGQANPLTAFVEEKCIRVSGQREQLQALYVAYCEWAKASGITRSLQKLTMKRHLSNLGYGSIKTNKGQAILDLKLQT